MRFAVFVIPGDKAGYEQGEMPSQETISRMMEFNEALAQADVLISLDGFQPTSKGARVRFDGKAISVVDGPFAESKEIIGGYWIWKLDSKAEAIEWAKKCPLEKGDVLEIRQLFEMEDHANEAGPDESAAIKRLQKRLGRAN